ncbi:MAG TPA: GIY-YIG nuclease family protein [Patescibacteria group bacterium]|nr:GIY-YIG nuclease family protein [Patescibacteria group bacterium]
MEGTELIHILQKLPDVPGIYLFFTSEPELIYVGKATSLRNRVGSYFKGQRNFRPIEEMIHEVKDIKWKETDSALEAIIWESIYIKKFQPKYNVIGKDNKSWNYIVITNDVYPRVFLMRQHEYDHYVRNAKTAKDAKIFAHTFGPYPGLNGRAAMKLLRRLFRFSSCEPGTRACLYYQMGQCIGICTGTISPEEYKRIVIRPLVLFLQGKKQQLITSLEKQMERLAKTENFEEAAFVREQLKSLYRIQDMALINKSFVWNTADEFSSPTEPMRKNVRIEGYDISNLGASEKVGSMVVFNEDGPVKTDYRKFIIRTVPGQSDVDSLAEVITRRLRHPEWPLPGVFLVDGGRPQINRVLHVLQGNGVTVPVVGIAKGPERKRNDFFLNNVDQEWKRWIVLHKRLLISVRDEAHRFAIAFHRERRGKALFGRSAM